MVRKILTTGLLIIVVLSVFALTGCKNEEETMNGKEKIVGNFSLTVTVDLTTPKIGDTITATITFKNLSDNDIEAEIPDWLVATMNKPIEDMTIEDILFAYFVTWDDFIWEFVDIAVEQRPSILIEHGTVIERQFEYTVTASGNLEIHAGAFFIVSSDTANFYGMQIVSTPIKFTV